MLALIVLAIVSGIAWILGFVVYHAASAAIHLLLLLAVVCGVSALVMRMRMHHHRMA